jgi:alkylation response protein AidB-like acyl-CoA dehydrogenase
VNTEFSEQAEALRGDVREFLDSALPATWSGVFSVANGGGVSGSQLSFELCRRLAERGWLIRQWPRDYGGADASVWEQVVLQEEYEAHFEPRGGQYMGVNWVGPALMLFGTEEQKRTLLPEIAAGDVQWAQLFSEPEAGSDLAAVSTTALLEDGEFVVRGEKVWTSYGTVAQRGFLVARTKPESTGRDGISVLLIDMRHPGVEVREIPAVLGSGRMAHEVFVDARFPESSLLGPLHDGWRVTMAALAFERVGIPGHARATRVLGRLGGLCTEEHEEAYIDLLVAGRLCELMYYDAVAERETGAPGWLNSAVRVVNARYLQDVARFAEDVLGPFARVSGSAIDEPAIHDEIESFSVKRAPVASMTSGTLEVQISLIARRALDLPRDR